MLLPPIFYTLGTLLLTALLACARSPDDFIVLGEADFQSTVAKGVWFIEFTSPYCAHCRRFLPTWTQLAAEMEDQAKGAMRLAQVNCVDSPVICDAQNVTYYPHLDLYKSGAHVETYSQTREHDRLYDYLAEHADPKMDKRPQMSAAPEPDWVKTKTGAVLELADGQVNAAVRNFEVLFLYLYDGGDNRRLNELEAAVEHLGPSFPPVFFSTSSALQRSLFPAQPLLTPALLVMKDHRFGAAAALTYFAAAHGAWHMQNWLLAHRLPSVVQLTKDTYDQLLLPDHAPLVLAAVPTEDEEARARIEEVALGWEKGLGRFQFAWVEGEEWRWWLEGRFGVERFPAVVVLEDQGRVYYDKDKEGRLIQLTQESIVSATQAIRSRSIPPKYSEHMFETLIRIIDEFILAAGSIVTNSPVVGIPLIIGLLIAIYLVVRRVHYILRCTIRRIRSRIRSNASDEEAGSDTDTLVPPSERVEKQNNNK